MDFPLPMYAPMMSAMTPKAPSSVPLVNRSPGVVGMDNVSFTCYANAAIQALANCPPLIRFLREQERRARANKESEKLREKFSRIILEIWSEKSNRTINAEDLLEALRTKTRLFEKDVQHDSQEFIYFLMLLLKEEEIKPQDGSIKFRRSDSGLGSLPVICHSSSVEEEENVDEVLAVEERVEECSKEKKKEKDAETLKRCDSGLELRSLQEIQSDNIVSIFEATIEITTKCQSCNKDSRISEVSETIRVPIPTKSTKSTTGNISQTPAVTRKNVQEDNCQKDAKDAKPVAENLTLANTAEPVKEEISPPSVTTKEPEAEIICTKFGENTDPDTDIISRTTSALDTANSSSTEMGAVVEDLTVTPATTVEPVMEENSHTPATVAVAEADSQMMTSDAVKEASLPPPATDKQLQGLVQCFKTVLCVLGYVFCTVTASPESAAIYEQLHEPSNKNQKNPPTSLTLSSCIEEMFKAETMDGENKYKCQDCDELTNASRRVKLLNLPEVMIFQLLRFTIEKGKVNKVQDTVEFPPVIDMAKYLPEDAAENGKKNSSYELVSVICHHGGSNGGHYTTFAKNDSTKQWHYFDDAKITEVSLETVLKQQAYILFYRQL